MPQIEPVFNKFFSKIALGINWDYVIKTLENKLQKI